MCASLPSREPRTCTQGACAASDVWALGCTLLHMLSGHPPLEGHRCERLAVVYDAECVAFWPWSLHYVYKLPNKPAVQHVHALMNVSVRVDHVAWPGPCLISPTCTPYPQTCSALPLIIAVIATILSTQHDGGHVPPGHGTHATRFTAGPAAHAGAAAGTVPEDQTRCTSHHGTAGNTTAHGGFDGGALCA